MMKSKALISLSGGMDSATVLAQARFHKRECTAIGFFYGSKHNDFENQKAKELANYYGIPFGLINLERVFAPFTSNLLREGGDIPEGHYEDESMKLTVVPGRNLIFISILAGLAESIGCSEIWLGIHAGDHAIYPDCRPAFYKAANEVILQSTEGKVSLVAPFLHISKLDILRRGGTFGVPYELTRTCYKEQELACGKCGSCQERLEAFRLAGIKHAIIYEGKD